MGGQEVPVIIGKTSLSIEGHVNGQNTWPKPRKYFAKIAKTKTTTGRGLRPRPTGARSAPVVAFFVKCEDSGPEQVTSLLDYAHFVFVWLDFLDYPDHSLSIHTWSKEVHKRFATKRGSEVRLTNRKARGLLCVPLVCPVIKITNCLNKTTRNRMGVFHVSRNL